MAAMRTAVEAVSSGLLSTAEPGAPPVVIATDEFSISAQLVTKLTEEPFESTAPDGTPITVVVTAIPLAGADPNTPVGAVTITSAAQLFPMRLAGDDAAGRRLQEGGGGGAASASQAGGTVSFSLYQDGQKLVVKDLDEPVQISVPVSSAKDLESSCAGQPSELELVNSMGSGKPGCLDAMECRYFDHNTSAWSTEGCATTQYNRSGVSAIGCSCSHLSDFVAVKVPTSLREKLDLALIVVPRSSPAADPPADYTTFDMTVAPGNRFIALTKDGASAPPTKVTVRLSSSEAEPAQLWRLVSIGCANGTAPCALPTSEVALADPSRRWQITRPEARLEPDADLVLSFNASGLPEDPATDAYSAEIGIEVAEASGAVRLVTLGVSASVAVEPVANRSSWGTVPPGRPCDEADLGEYAAPLVPAVVGRPLRVPLSLCDFEGLAVERGLPRVTDTRFVSFELAQIQAADDARPPSVLASTRGVYQGGALYFSAMSLPHLGDFALTALLGSEPIGAPLHLRGACPEGLRPKPDGVNCGCPPGSTAGGGTGSALTCTPCAAGTASAIAGGECDPCPAGHFSTEGAAQCSPCARGQFNRELMATKCRPCPSGTYSAPGASECLVCGLRDVSQRTVETAEGDVGSTSPYGIDCEDGVVGALDANGTVTGVLPGHWAGAPVDETNANVTRVWACETAEACLGGAESACRAGHEGVLCAGCMAGYTRSATRLCEPFDADEGLVALGAALLSIGTLLVSAMLGVAIALLCCRLARPPKPPIVPPWMEKDGDAVVPSAAESVTKGEKQLNLLERATGLDLDGDGDVAHAGVASKSAARSMGYDVWVHREVDPLVSFPFGESVAQELRRFGIDARVEPAPSPDTHPKSTAGRSSKAGFVSVRPRQSGLAREGPLMTEFGWRGLLQVLKIQRRFRALLQRRQAPGGGGSPGGGLRGANKPPEDEMENAAVCLFCLTDNIFKDERSVLLFARAVKLGKQCELIVMPKAKWGPARDRPFPENVFNPTWKPYLPDLSPAFTTIAINWELEYKPACVLQVVERVVPFLTSPIDLQAARRKCTAMETEELRRAAAWKPAEMELKWDWSSKTFDVFLSHKITDAKDIVLGWYNTLSAMTYKPFLDRLSLDKVENIPRYITETATVLIAVTTNLFESYWCAVELCKAVECHAKGTLNILLCPIQNDMWAVPGGDGAKLPFPTPAMVMANFGKWFPELKDSTRELIELLYGGGPYTESRTVYHTLSHYLNFERLLIARIGPSIQRQLQSLALLASGQHTSAELLAALGMQVDEANAIELARAKGDLANARRFEIDLAGRDGSSANLESRLGFDENVVVEQATAKGTMRVAELHGEQPIRSHSYDEFQALLATLRSESASIARAASKASAAIEALLAFEEVQPLAFGEILSALKELQPTLSQAFRAVLGFLQINGSFLHTFKVPWPAGLRRLLATFGLFNLDFFDSDAASKVLGRALHYGNATLGLCFAFLFLLLGIFLSHRWVLAPRVRRRDAAWSVALEDNCVRGAVMCCSLLYPVLAARLLALYRLVEFDDLVMLEPDLRLSSDAARPWQMAGLPFTFLLVVGMPCAALAVLWRTARPGALDKPHIKPAEKVRLEARYLRRYGQLYQMYEPRCWWWEMVEIARKLLLIAILGYFRPGSAEQLWTGVLIALTSILLLTYFGPMVDPKLDAVGWISQTATLLTLLGGAALTGSQGPDCDCDAFIGILGVFLPVVNVLPLFVIVYLVASTVFDLYGSQKARKPPPKCGVLSDEGPANSIADHCRRKDMAPLPPSSAAASLRRALTQRWFALHAIIAKPSPVHPARDLAAAPATTDGGSSAQEGPTVDMAVGSRVEHAKHGLGTVSSAIGTSKNDPVHADGTPLGVLVDFDNGETHRYMRAAWHKLSVLPPGTLEGKGATSLSEEESTHIKQAGLVAGARVEHPKHGLGMVQSFQGATMGHPLYADGTPLKVKIAFDDGQTHEYKTASWHKLRVVGYQPPEPPAQSEAGEVGLAPGMVVGARIEHAKHGHGTVQHIDLEAKHPKVKAAFDNGETHEYKGGSLEKLRVLPAAEVQAVGRKASAVAALADRAVLLEAKAHCKAESTFYKLAKVQLLAAPAHEGAPAHAGDADAGALPWSMIVVNGKGLPCEEVTAVRVDERGLEFVMEHAKRSASARTERLHVRMESRSEFGLWRDALRVETLEALRALEKAARKSPSPELLRSGQASPGGSPSSRGGALADGERVLLQGRMSVRISGSPYHVPMMLKITAASDCAQRKEPWTTFSYTSKHESVAVPCRAISAVRIHANDANPSFEIEYSAPRADASPHKEPPAAEGRKTSLPPRVSVRMRVWATSRAQFEEWRTALAPLPLVNVHAMDRARSWLDSHMSELRGLEDQLEDEAEQRRSKKLFDGSV